MKWEYKIFRETHDNLMFDTSTDDFCMERMNELGQEGWEIFHMTTDHTCYECKSHEAPIFRERIDLFMFAKRPMKEDEKCS